MTPASDVINKIKEEISKAPKTILFEGSYGPVIYELCGIYTPHLLDLSRSSDLFQKEIKVNSCFHNILNDGGWSRLIYKPFDDIIGNENKPISIKRKQWERILKQNPFISLTQKLLSS